MAGRRSLRTTGIVFGIWLSWLYAFIADQINRMSLPGVPLPDPPGGMWGYYLGAIVVGALMGLVCVWPGNIGLGIALSGLLGSALTFLAPWRLALSSLESSNAISISALAIFFSLGLVLMPFALLARLSVGSLSLSGEGWLSLRRIGLPVLTILIVAWLGSANLYSASVREAFYITQKLIQQGIESPNQSQLPESLQPVQGFKPNATGSFTLEWSNATAKFIGPRPVVDRHTDFLIIVRFRNGFSLACDFPPGVQQPPCANFR
jgi:hypothetical protein